MPPNADPTPPTAEPEPPARRMEFCETRQNSSERTATPDRESAPPSLRELVLFGSLLLAYLGGLVLVGVGRCVHGARRWMSERN